MAEPVDTQLTVRYAETDAQGVVHHANYLVWFELGRSSFLRHFGMRYAEWEKLGLYAVVADVEVRYRAPAFYDDEVTVKTSLVKARKRFFQFDYEVKNQHGELLVAGTTRHLITGRDRKPASLPDDLYRQLKTALAHQ